MLVKTEAGYPKVRFLDAKVRINLYKGAKTGDYRLVEVLEESDESWGLLAGYGSADDLYAYSPSLSPEKAVAFVNTNRNTPVEIEKVMEEPSNAEFSMVLERVVSATQNPVISPDQIVEAEPGTGIEYTVYDAETEELIRTDVTGSSGEIRLHAGQYARLMLPDGTLWTVTETRSADHTLKGMTGTSDKLTKLEENLMLIRQEAEVIPGGLEVLVKEEVHSGEVLEKENFTVNVVYSDGSRKTLRPEEYTLTPDTAADSAGPMDVTVSWTEGDLEAAVSLNVVGEIEITREMVEAGVKDAESGEDVNIKSGEVTIPEYIIWKGNKYQVVGIGDYAYGDTYGGEINLDIRSIHFPDSVKRIGDYAFSQCDNLTGTLELPKGLTEIGGDAFFGCDGLTGKLTIPNSVNNIEKRAFGACSGLTGLVISDGVTSIGESAFDYCVGLTGDLILPDSVTSIGKNAFSGCWKFDGTLKISNSVTTIEEGTFYNCRFTGRLNIPDNVTSIGVDAFSTCAGFTELHIPDSVTTIGDQAFRLMGGIEKLEIPNGVISIGSKAFAGCRNLTGDLIIPNSVQEIGMNAFSTTNLDNILVYHEEGGITGAPWGWDGTVTWLGQ